ncbi:hypothetical protein PAPYR_6911 [Paratrimastix pyriformis]|uniref:F-box domain-containing protein n=1 Tax=Paratrimastix pyriformis TaxID=342808 RepID=A0ABQ8UE83_9EUKA|nr:hypothetical protein PAPYR_6911 [Paratrimastix pyriformis]
MDNLPSEIVGTILAQTSSFQTFCRLTAVSQRWRVLASQYQRVLSTLSKKDQNSNSVTMCPSHLPMDHSVLVSILARCAGLEELILDGMTVDQTCRWVDALPPSGLSLRHLSVRRCDIFHPPETLSELLARCPYLQSLHATVSRADGILPALAAHCSGIHTLDFASDVAVSPADLCSLAQCPELRHLGLSLGGGQGEGHVLFSTRHPLESLSLTTFSPAVLPHLGPALTTLRLHGPVGGATLRLLADSGPPPLRHLVLGLEPDTTPDLLRLLAGCAHRLETLALGSPSLLAVPELVTALASLGAAGLPALEELTLSALLSPADSGAPDARPGYFPASLAPRLRGLRLDGCGLPPVFTVAHPRLAWLELAQSDFGHLTVACPMLCRLMYNPPVMRAQGTHRLDLRCPALSELPALQSFDAIDLQDPMPHVIRLHGAMDEAQWVPLLAPGRCPNVRKLIGVAVSRRATLDALLAMPLAKAALNVFAQLPAAHSLALPATLTRLAVFFRSSLLTNADLAIHGPGLRRLDVSSSAIRRLRLDCPVLERLALMQCGELRAVEFVGPSPGPLAVLSADGCRHLERPALLDVLRQTAATLRSVRVANYERAVSKRDLARLPTTDRLDMPGLYHLTLAGGNIRSLQLVAPLLVHLDLSGNAALSTLSAQCPRLVTLTTHGCPALKQFLLECPRLSQPPQAPPPRTRK